jgi:hypothetical protein
MTSEPNARVEQIVLLTVVTCAAGCLLVCAPAGAQDGNHAGYEAAIASALEHYRARDWAAARAGFEAAHAIDPGARTLRGIGLCAYYAQDYVAAAIALEQALAESRHELSAEQRVQTLDLLNRTYARVARLRVRAVPANASVSVNDRPIPNDQQVPLAPGLHHLEVRLEGRMTHAEDFEAEAGEQVSLPIVLALAEPAPSPRAAAEDALRPTAESPIDALRAGTGDRDRLPTWIAGGATIAFATAALAFAIAGNAELDDIERECRLIGCSESARAALWQDSSIETFETLTNVALVATAAGAATTLTLFLTSSGAGDNGGQPAARSRPTAGVRLAGRF